MTDGKTIAITRSREDAAEFIAMAEKSGARPIPLPTIQLVETGKDTAGKFLEQVQRYDPDYCVFMSSKVVRLLFDSASRSSIGDRLRLAIANTTAVAVGPVTKASLAEHGIRARHMPERTFSSVGVGEVLSAICSEGEKVIVPRSGAATPFLGDLLRKIGLDVLEVRLYDVRAAGRGPAWDGFAKMLSESAVDGIVFTSASSVRGFFEIMQKYRERERLAKELAKTRVVAIGPFTADELAQFGLDSAVARVHTVAGAFEAAVQTVPTA